MEDEEYSKAVFYTRLFAFIALMILFGFICRQLLKDIYLWVIALKEGPATFIVGVIGFGGLIGTTFYNGFVQRKLQENEKIIQARNNAVILDSESI
ncbi:hypothetical protein GQF03_07210 [Sneathiella chungangensis]|uniref:Uncharacterized protein n=1 Tax=Sneathiella chungangensis TaxID=1418234 RepID=A0A845MGD8_9PROT|nr:hypothetical protein [Sneathiella chungangensis]MZR22114.1 hypothetical protein [Sneathiella chungangensis]